MDESFRIDAFPHFSFFALFQMFFHLFGSARANSTRDVYPCLVPVLPHAKRPPVGWIHLTEGHHVNLFVKEAFSWPLSLVPILSSDWDVAFVNAFFFSSLNTPIWSFGSYYYYNGPFPPPRPPETPCLPLFPLPIASFSLRVAVGRLFPIRRRAGALRTFFPVLFPSGVLFFSFPPCFGPGGHVMYALTPPPPSAHLFCVCVMPYAFLVNCFWDLTLQNCPPSTTSRGYPLTASCDGPLHYPPEAPPLALRFLPHLSRMPWVSGSFSSAFPPDNWYLVFFFAPQNVLFGTYCPPAPSDLPDCGPVFDPAAPTPPCQQRFFFLGPSQSRE